MTNEHWTLLKSTVETIWVAAGPLVGVWTGAYLSKRWQRDQWIADNKRAEYRKLLTTLTRAYSTLINTYSKGVISGREEKKCERAVSAAANVLRDRIFIAKEVEQMGIVRKWSIAVGEINTNHNWKVLLKAYPEISATIQEYAARIMD